MGDEGQPGEFRRVNQNVYADREVGNRTQQVPGLNGLQVDPAHLENAITYLQNVADYLSRTARTVELTGSYLPATPAVSADGGGGTAFGGPIVGDASTLAQKHERLRTTVRTELDAIVKDCRQAASATRRIIENYQTVEERNAANGQAILRAFTEEG